MTVQAFSLPLATPLATASGQIDRRQGFLIDVDHRGVIGIGEATPLPRWTESLDDCERALDAAANRLTDQGHRAALRGLDGDDVPAARHGLATALLDADARADGQSLAEWLGRDRVQESVPVNATVGDTAVEETVATAQRAVSDGFDCLKVKVGARELGDDLDRVRAVRDVVGEHVDLRVDANGAWSRETASTAVDALAALDVDYVEQPLAAKDLSGHGDLQDRGIDIALDEALLEWTADAIFDAEVADRLVLKPMVVGGPGTAHTLALRARDAGLEPVVTTTVDGVVARTAAVQVAAAVPDIDHCGLATAGYLETDLGPDPAPVRDGRIRVPTDDGLGIDPEEVAP